MIISDKYYVYTRGPIDYFTLLIDEYELIGLIKKDLFKFYGPGTTKVLDDNALWRGLKSIIDGVTDLIENEGFNLDIVCTGFFVVYNPTSGDKHTDTEVGYLIKIKDNGTTIIALPYKVEGADDELLGEFTMQ